MDNKIKGIISKVVLSDKKIKIKLLGDSITHGYAGTGYEQNGEEFIEGFRRNKDGFCWANLFKAHMESRFNCVVNNNGCSGVKIEYLIENFDKLVDSDDDIIICAIGTNNRHVFFHEGDKPEKFDFMKDFYNNILKLHKLFEDAKKEVIYIANIPCSVALEKDQADYWRISHMNDINDMFLKASVECNFPLISLYNRFMEYCDLKEIELTSLLADGLHPNDKGYEIMFKLLMSELGLGLKIVEE